MTKTWGARQIIIGADSPQLNECERVFIWAEPFPVVVRGSTNFCWTGTSPRVTTDKLEKESLFGSYCVPS